MSDALNKSEDLWSSYKGLKKIIWKSLSDDPDDVYAVEFENTLRKYKQNFFSLLQNQPKNAKSREELKKGMVDGIVIKGLGHQILSKELYQEAIILSDMYDMNEFVALDLLCTAQIQMSFYPGLPRGLVAVLLYYDGRKSLVQSLRYLVQARTGVQWSVSIKPDVEKFVTTYTDQLMEGGLFNRIFELLRTLDLSKEMDKLQENLALGGPRHRRQVMDLFQDIRVILADIVFTWAAQSGLPKAPTLALINYLRQAEIEEEASGKLDNVNLYLIMALLSAFDLSVLHSREDGEEAVQSLPILSDPDYVNTVINELQPGKPKWKCEGLQAVATFGLAVCLASLRLIPQNQQFQDVINKEETFVDAAIENHVFEFIHNIILENEVLYKETFVYKRMHHLITDFIVYMYPKVKELRIKADEIARTVQIYTREGLDAPANLPRYFEYLLLTIAKVYSKDILNTEYVLSYWSPVELNSTQYSSHRSSSRAVSLFKFVRLAGDMLPPTLFVPYLTMLSSLSSCPQAARHCFNMLKQVGPQLTATLSWDHFFTSFAQYYNNLRQELPPVTDTVYRNTYLKGVSPQELEGLHAVLLLIRTIADHDEFSRLALCEHPGWAPLTILLGLVGCSVPIPLKSDLLLTLASLSKSAENAAQMWDNLETSQILVTVPTTSSYAPRGIQTELDEIEARLEEYPLTRAMLKLLDVLTDFGIPRTLGAGPRPPGFDPYLSFIVNSIFLKFHTRSYRNSSEKWEIAKLCLKLFEKFLTQYDPQISDFPKKNLPSEFNPPPGYHLMLQLNNKSELLSVILDIIDEGNRLFDTYVSFPNQQLLEECTLLCLNIIHSVLALHGKFVNVLTASSASILLTNLTKLLLTINRRTGKPDHCVNIAKYVSYQPYLLKHSHVVVKILNHVTNTPLLHNQFINIFLSSDAKDEIKHGFVLSLDSDVAEEDAQLTIKTKLEILKLIKHCLPYTAPNFSHFLLGFDIRKDISKTEFQYSGVLDFPRSCLHSIISLMEAEVVKESSITSPLLESAYEVIFLLSSNSKTYGPVLRFLRLNKKFFTYHLNLCRSRINEGLHVLNQISWLMKTLAVELKICGQSKQVSYMKQLTHFLVSLPQIENNTNQDPFSATYKEDVREGNYMFLERISNNFLVNLIPHFEFKPDTVQAPEWQFFDAKVLNVLLDHCVQDGGQKLIDLKKLHQRLYDEVKLLQGTAVMGQIQAVTQEIPKVLKYALELNKNKEKYASIVQFVDAWRQVVEVLMVFIPHEILSVKESQLVGVCFVLNLLKRVGKIELLPEVGQLLSGAVLLIIENLRKCHIYERKQQNFSSETDIPASMLQMLLGSLKEVLENLIEWIMVSNVTDEKLKINLYAALVTLLELASLEKPPESASLSNSMYVSRLDNSRVSIENHLQNFKMSTDSLAKFGERLVEVMCQDCIGGYDVSRMLALSSFSVLITLSGNINWIAYMSGRGYLKVIIQSILDSNNDLERLLEPGQTSIKPLYVYMSKVLFLGRLAGTRVGAELLLEQKIFSCFGNMNVFSYHPEIAKTWRPNDILESFVPPPEELYLQMWLPTLEVCNAILTTLGTDNQSAVVQIMYFILNHLDVVETILRSGSPSLSRQFLKELSLLTSVIARTANNNLVNILENPDIVHDQRAHLFRIQKLTLALLPKFILTDEVVKELVNRQGERSHTFQTSERLLFAMQVMANLLSYSRNVVANHDVEHGGIGVIFQPTLKDPGLNSVDLKNGLNFNDQTPSLGVVVQQLINVVNHHHQEKFTYELLERKIKEIPVMDSTDVDEFIEESLNLQDVNTKREHVYDLISNRLEKKRKEMQYCCYIIENAIYLIWVHLDYYMLKAIPKVKNFGSLAVKSPMTPGTLASATEATWKVSTDDISNLKHGLVSIFNDSFTKQLLETIQDQSDLDKGFVETMLRKIIRLIQFVPVK
ncbi:nuclear pore complex protein Nup205 [Tribolium castaneum]|uniref:Nuclear pore complex protein Nup205-like Protein n=1 Tax=Tribolium castaneum TaxID=7070 RepID=D6WGY3_TRICA|nr:PREDICTED: nuclear pore complex protein Nup205 [Tribolium castaneum]EFA00605.1 Nuclear pore complex protein Nup205-like Protein [Tribolium castaneum]|eukprot:XP_008190932.1 PREDICTED: nuclear pore complex protein Nup205 [Tribolium castaneum]